jgi:hypothetical protein
MLQTLKPSSLLPKIRLGTCKVERLFLTQSLGRHVDVARFLERHVSWVEHAR